MTAGTKPKKDPMVLESGDPWRFVSAQGEARVTPNSLRQRPGKGVAGWVPGHE